MSRPITMHHLYRLLAVVAFVLCAHGVTAHAQSIFRPFHINAGYNAALEKARDTLASDAYLVYAGTFGNMDLSPYGIPGILNFYQDTEGPQGQFVDPGQADAWGYVFYSPSLQRTVNLVVVNTFITGGYYASGVDIDLPLPSNLTELLDLRLDGTGGDSLMARVKRNTVFADYHGRYPQKQPTVVSLGLALPEDVVAPSGFVANGPSWSMTYDASGDTTGMVCVVSSGSGQVVCSTFATSAVYIEQSAVRTIAAFPNPATSTLRIDVAQTAQLHGDITLTLLDAGGRTVADLGRSLFENDLRFAVVDVAGLTSGAYFCRLTVGSTSHIVPVRIVASH